MNTDIRVAVGFWHHPKTKRLIREAGFEAVRSLQILWMWAAQNRPNGDISDLDAADIEAAADWYGPEGQFYVAIRERWLDETQEGLFLHEWIEHNPWAADAEERSGRARFAKLAQVNETAFDHLKAQGVESITAEEYVNWKKYGSKQLHAERMQSECRAYASECTANALHTDLPQAPAPAPSPSLKTKTKKLSASDDAAGANGDAFYETKKKRKLDGKRLESFNLFWNAFSYPKGKAEAADVWLDIPELTNGLVQKILTAAQMEAELRPKLISQGKTPKMAQGWLSGRRWEDETFECRPMTWGEKKEAELAARAQTTGTETTGDVYQDYPEFLR